MRRLGPLHVRPDEEPDVERLTYGHLNEWPSGCVFCGRYGHRQIACPERPLGDLNGGSRNSRQTERNR